MSGGGEQRSFLEVLCLVLVICVAGILFLIPFVLAAASFIGAVLVLGFRIIYFLPHGVWLKTGCDVGVLYDLHNRPDHPVSNWLCMPIDTGWKGIDLLIGWFWDADVSLMLAVAGLSASVLAVFGFRIAQGISNTLADLVKGKSQPPR